jgi:hypothetical protein
MELSIIDGILYYALLKVFTFLFTMRPLDMLPTLSMYTITIIRGFAYVSYLYRSFLRYKLLKKLT